MINGLEVPSAEILLSDVDREDILISAYALLPEQHFGRAVQKLPVQDQMMGRQSVSVWFEPETVSADRTETYIAYCGRQMADYGRQVRDLKWRCHAVSQLAHQLLPGGSEPIQVRGPISESAVLDAAATLWAFVFGALEQPPENFEIQSMIRLGPTHLDGPEEPEPGIQAKAHIGVYEIAMDLYPIAENSEQLAVARITCYSNLEKSNPECSVSESSMLTQLSRSAEMNHRELVLSEIELQNLLTIIRSMVSNPELLAHVKSTDVKRRADSVYVGISFEPTIQSNTRSVIGSASCTKDGDGENWRCEVSEHVKLKIPGQELPVWVNGLTDKEVLRLVAGIRELLPNHPKLEMKVDELRILGIDSDASHHVDATFSGPIIAVHVLALQGLMLDMAVDQVAFEMGEIMVVEIRSHQM